MHQPLRGPIIGALTLAGALSGRSVETLSAACRLFGVDGPTANDDPIDALRVRSFALARLWAALRRAVTELAYPLNVPFTVSTGAVAGAMLSAGGLPALAPRVALPDDLAGPFASAFYGGWHSARVTHTAVPAVLADINSTYPRVFSALGLGRHLVATGVTPTDVTDEVRELVARPDLEAALYARGLWQGLGVTLVKVRPQGDHLPVKVNHHVAIRPLDLAGDTGRWHWADVAASVLHTGAWPEIVEAVQLVPGSPVESLQTVRLPTGRLVDLLEDDLALSMVEERATLKVDDTLPAWRREQLGGLLKLMANALTFGNLARVDRTKVPVSQTDEIVAPDGSRLVVRTGHVERPGPWCSLALAGAVTAGARLVMALAMQGIEQEAGTWLHAAADSLLIAATHDDAPQMAACPGGGYTTSKRSKRAALQALPLDIIRALLARSDAVLCPEGARAWKEETGWDRPMSAYVSGTNLFGAVDADGQTEHVTEVGLGGVYADPTGTNRRTADGHWVWAAGLHSGVLRHGVVRRPRSAVIPEGLPGVDEPALRPCLATTPDHLRRLRRAFPEARPFTSYLAGQEEWGGRPLVGLSNDATQWRALEWRTTDGAPVQVSVRGDRDGDGPTDGATITLRNLGAVLGEWASHRDPTTAAVAETDLRFPEGLRRPAPLSTRIEWASVIGKETDDLLAHAIDPLGARDGSIFRGPDTWSPVLEQARQLGAPEVARLTGLSYRTVRYAVTGRPASTETRQVIAEALAKAESAPAAEPRTCALAGCGRRVSARRKWCSDRCTMAGHRAAIALAAVPIELAPGRLAFRCAEHGPVEHSVPECPTCGGPPARRVKRTGPSFICPACDIDWGPGPTACSACERKEAVK